MISLGQPADWEITNDAVSAGYFSSGLALLPHTVEGVFNKAISANLVVDEDYKADSWLLRMLGSKASRQKVITRAALRSRAAYTYLSLSGDWLVLENEKTKPFFYNHPKWRGNLDVKYDISSYELEYQKYVSALFDKMDKSIKEPNIRDFSRGV